MIRIRREESDFDKIADMSYHENDFDYEDVIENEDCDSDPFDEHAAVAEEKATELEVLEPINHYEHSSDSADTDSEHQTSPSSREAAADIDSSSTNDSEWRVFWREFRKLTIQNAERAKARKEAKEKIEKQATRAAVKAEKIKKSAMQQGWVASPMELERPSKLVPARPSECCHRGIWHGSNGLERRPTTDARSKIDTTERATNDLKAHGQERRGKKSECHQYNESSAKRQQGIEWSEEDQEDQASSAERTAAIYLQQLDYR